MVQASNDLNEFIPGKLPGNDFAFMNSLFLHPRDFQYFKQQNDGQEPVFVKAKNFVMELESLSGIELGQIGAGACQKETLRLSKIDNLRIDVIRIKNDNPLETVECLIDAIFVDPKQPREPGKPLALEQNEIGEAITKLFSAKYLNRGEIFPMKLREGQVVIKVTI